MKIFGECEWRRRIVGNGIVKVYIVGNNEFKYLYNQVNSDCYCHKSGNDIENYFCYYLKLINLVSTYRKKFPWSSILIAIISAAAVVTAAVISKPSSSEQMTRTDRKLMFAGRVSDENGNAIPYALVQIVGKSNPSYTESNGNFRLEVLSDTSLSENRISVIVSHKGYKAKNQTIILPDEAVQIILTK